MESCPKIDKVYIENKKSIEKKLNRGQDSIFPVI